MLGIECRQWGILLVVAGTILVAFSFPVKQGMDRSLRRQLRLGKNLLVPSEVRLVRWSFWLGLLLIVIGSALQW